MYNKNASSHSFEVLYRGAYRLVLGKNGDELYNRVERFTQNILATNVRGRISRHLSGTVLGKGLASYITATDTEKRETGERFMKELCEAYSDHNTVSKMIADVLMYLVGLDELLYKLLIYRTVRSVARLAGPKHTYWRWHYFETMCTKRHCLMNYHKTQRLRF
jgi:hypothetical protein